MAEPQDGPVFVVKLAGILSQEDIKQYIRRCSEQLPGRVVVVDNTVEDIYKMTRLDVEKLAMMLEDASSKE